MATAFAHADTILKSKAITIKAAKNAAMQAEKDQICWRSMARDLRKSREDLSTLSTEQILQNGHCKH